MKKYGIQKAYSIWFAVPALILFSVFFIVPNLASFVLGFTDWSLFNFYDIRFNGLDNFVRLFTEKHFIRTVLNTFYFAIVTVILKNVLGFVLALIAYKPGKFNNYLRVLIFFTITISSMVVAIIFLAIYNPTNGIINETLRFLNLDSLTQDWLFNAKYSMLSICAMEVWQWTGFNFVIFIAGLQAIPHEYYEAASIDGAGRWQRLIHITVPLMVQSINVTFIFSVISGLKVFTQVYATTNGGPAGATQVLSTYLYNSFGQGYLGYSSAVGLFITIMIMSLTLGVLRVLRKHEVEL